MNNTIWIIIIIFISIFLWSIRNIVYNRKEHLSNQSDEAIQNLASLYNKDELTIGKMNVTGPISATGSITGASFTDKSMDKSTIKEYIDTKLASLDSKLTAAVNVQKGRVDYIDANTAYRGRAYRIKTNSNWIRQNNRGPYGSYLYAGNHDQALWRQPGGHPEHTADRHSFTIE